MSFAYEKHKIEQHRARVIAAARRRRCHTTLNNVVLPIIRRVMPNVLANQIIGAQPMTAPAGQIFTLGQRYGNPAQNLNAPIGAPPPSPTPPTSPAWLRAKAALLSGQHDQRTSNVRLSDMLADVHETLEERLARLKTRLTEKYRPMTDW